jgi:hypothetical protein
MLEEQHSASLFGTERMASIYTLNYLKETSFSNVSKVNGCYNTTYNKKFSHEAGVSIPNNKIKNVTNVAEKTAKDEVTCYSMLWYRSYATN